MARDDAEVPNYLLDWSRRDFLKRTGQVSAVVATAGGLTAFLEACGGSSSSTSGGTSSTVKVSIPPVPSVPSDIVSAAKKYSGKKIVMSHDPGGIGGPIDTAAAAQFKKDTGVEVQLVVRPASTSDTYAQYQRLLTSKSTTPDILMIDVVYPIAFAQFLSPLDDLPLMSDEAKLHFPNIIANNTYQGKLVAMPWFGDFGLLYYRKDLLTKYGYSAPPATWDDLTAQATKIQAGEKAANPNFYGYVFQGNAYEGLTCNALEWLASSNGGTIVDKDGKVTVDNPEAVHILKLVQSWIGKISPTGVTSFAEEDARNAFDSGAAAFMRNWPYAYTLSADPKNSKIVGNFDVAPLPHGAGQSSACVGGWQLSINGQSANKEAAAAFIAYQTGVDFQKYRAINGTFVPSMPAIGQDSGVIKAEPFLTVQTNRVTRPSQLGTKYNQASTYFFQGVNQILRGSDVSQTLTQVKSQIQGL
ncbi:MAG: ABC transporter substrate-binding protein [Candidatus Dormibacteraeota bacterium]|nr:ABC transporter substrate-binding protein [Candidatus Dormibacteraeota bacterium]